VLIAIPSVRSDDNPGKHRFALPRTPATVGITHHPSVFLLGSLPAPMSFCRISQCNDQQRLLHLVYDRRAEVSFQIKEKPCSK
jgi:hypothetical protein